MSHAQTLSVPTFWRERVPLTVKVILLIGVVGALSWSGLERLQDRRITALFQNHLEGTLQERFRESQSRLEEDLRGRRQGVKLFAAQKRLYDYLTARNRNGWSMGAPQGVIHHQRPPAWLPPASMLRHFAGSAHFLLLDAELRLREVYQGGLNPFPVDRYAETFRDYVQPGGPTSITQLDGIPHFIASAPALGENGETLGVLAFIAPFDNDFLMTFQRRSDSVGVLVFIDNETQEVMASSDPEHAPQGAEIARLKEDFLIVGRDFFNYQFSSEMIFQAASLIPREELAGFQEEVLRSGRTEKAVSALVYLGAFVAIFLGITARLGKLRGQIESFSEKNLGVVLENPRKGDQFHDLRLLLERFTEEISRSRMGLEQELVAHRETSEKLTESEARFRNLVENTNDWVWELDARGRFSYSSPRSQELLGYAPQEILGKPPSIFMEAWEGERVRAKFNEMAAKREPLESFINVNLRRDGGRLWLETNGVPNLDADGGFLGYHGISRNITKRVRAEKSLQESNDRFQTVLDSLNALVYVADLESYELLFLNRYGQDLVGEALGRPCWETLRRGLDRPCGHCANDRLLDEEGEPNEGVSWEYRDEVDGCWYAVQDRAIRWVDGRLAHLSVATDITAQKDLQESIRQVKNRMEMEERKRLGDLLHESIGQSLSAIKLGLEMRADRAKREGEPEEDLLASEIGAVGSAIAQLRQVTTELRPTFLERMDLGEAVAWWCGQLGRNVREQIVFTCEGEFSGLDDEVKYNSFRILQETLTNALKHAQADVITISLVRTESDLLEMEIADNGRGMERAQTSEDGLGLFLIEEQAGRLGGTADIESAPGEGVRIRVRTPL